MHVPLLERRHSPVQSIPWTVRAVLSSQRWNRDMISCCSGAELQLRVGDDITLRELYPTKSDLYERARTLQDEHAHRQSNVGEFAN